MRSALVVAVTFTISACATAPTPEPVSAPEPTPPPQQSEAPAAPAEADSSEPPVLILNEAGFKTPESVYFDKDRDVYFVSNINGKPLDVDGNGFISKLYYDGRGKLQIDLKFIDGEKEGITLNAPKGLTVAGSTLYVADIDRVRKFNAETGAPEGEILLKGATFVNDVATGKDDQIYVTDSGLTAEFETNNTDAVYRIVGDKPKKLISGGQLGSPNGVLATEDGVWVTTFKSGELYFVSDQGKKSHVQKLPQGGNDGIIYTEDGRLLIASWEASTILAGPYEGPFATEISGVESPADIGYDCNRNKVLIPLFTKDTVIIHTLSDKPISAPPTVSAEDDARAKEQELSAQESAPAAEVLPAEESAPDGAKAQ